MNRIVFTLLTVYGIGVALSQSLMSLGGSVFCIFFGYLFLKKFRALPKNDLYICLAFCGYSLFLLVNLGFNATLHNFNNALSSVPLWLVPICGLLLSPLEREQVKTIHFFLFLAFLAVLIKSLYQVLYLNLPWAVGWHKNPIYLAYSLLPALAYFGYQLRKNHKSALLWCLSLIILSILILTASRTAMVVGIFYVITVVVWPRKPTLKTLMTTGAFGVVALTIIILVAWQIPQVKAKFLELQNINSLISFNARIDLWKFNFNLFLENPFIGVGYKQNGINASTNPMWAKYNFLEPQLYYAHNIYLQCLAESGLLGALLIFGGLIALAVLHPSLWHLLGVTFIAGVTENSWSNSKPLHSFLFFMLLTLLTHRQKTPRQL